MIDDGWGDDQNKAQQKTPAIHQGFDFLFLN